MIKINTYFTHFTKNLIKLYCFAALLLYYFTHSTNRPLEFSAQICVALKTAPYILPRPGQTNPGKKNHTGKSINSHGVARIISPTANSSHISAKTLSTVVNLWQ